MLVAVPPRPSCRPCPAASPPSRAGALPSRPARRRARGAPRRPQPGQREQLGGEPRRRRCRTGAGPCSRIAADRPAGESISAGYSSASPSASMRGDVERDVDTAAVRKVARKPARAGAASRRAARRPRRAPNRPSMSCGRCRSKDNRAANRRRNAATTTDATGSRSQPATSRALANATPTLAFSHSSSDVEQRPRARRLCPRPALRTTSGRG